MKHLVRRSSVLIAVTVSQLALWTPANAYTAADIHGTKWTTNPTAVPWRFSTDVPQDMRAAITAGAAVWGNLGRDFAFSLGSGDAADFDAVNLANKCSITENTVHFEPLPEGTLATTYPCLTPATSPTTVTKFLMVFNSNKSWYKQTSGTPGGGGVFESDLMSVAAHEFGHATGFTGPQNNGHFLNTDPQCTGATLANQTMCESIGFNEDYGRTLEPDEVHIFSNVYSGTNTYCGYTIYGTARTKYLGLGGSGGVLGCPQSEEHDVRDYGRQVDFANGSMTYAPWIPAYHVRNAIAQRWKALGGTDWAFPTTDETVNPDGVGVHNHFRAQTDAITCGQGNSRSIYWSPATGAHAVQGPIRISWCGLGWEGAMGYPTMDESLTGNGEGYYQHFLMLNQSGTCGTTGNKSIYYRPQTGAHAVINGIRQRWCQLGWENFGWPTSDETPTSPRTGAYNTFSRYNGSTFVDNGAIVWSPPLGMWDIWGSFWDKWSALNRENGVLGFPKTAATHLPSGGDVQTFEYGQIFDRSDTGTHEVHGPILTAYLNEGGSSSQLGYPTSDVTTLATGDTRVTFEGGSIVWLQVANRTVVVCGNCTL